MPRYKSLLAFAALLHCACIPYYGHGGGEPRAYAEAVFRDASNGEPSPAVLVIVCAKEFGGVSVLKTPHDAWEVGGNERYLTRPFVHESGSWFQIRYPKDVELIFFLPLAMLGWDETLEGVTVIAPGYRSLFLDRDELNTPDLFKLTPLSAIDSASELSELKRLLAAEQLAGRDTERFRRASRYAPSASDTLDVSFTPEERELVQAFLARASTTPVSP